VTFATSKQTANDALGVGANAPVCLGERENVARSAKRASKLYAVAGLIPIVAEILASSRGSDTPCVS
jgi:hypothetical protein